MPFNFALTSKEATGLIYTLHYLVAAVVVSLFDFFLAILFAFIKLIFILACQIYFVWHGI